MSEASARVGALIDLGRPADAATEARRLLAQHPDDVELILNAGVAWTETGESDWAMWAARSAVTAAPDDPDVNRVASAIWLRVGGGTLARELAERAVELAPDDPAGHVELAFACAHVGDRGALRRGLVAAQEAVRLAPDHHGSHNALGAIEYARGRPTAAAAAFDRALELAPDTSEYHTNAAMARHRIGDLRTASRHAVAAGRASQRDDRPIDDLRRFEAQAFGGGWTVWSLVGFTVGLVALIGLIATSIDADSRAVVIGVAAAVWVVAVTAIVRSARHRLRLDRDADDVLRNDRDLRG